MIGDTPRATAVAREIHAKFLRKMAKGGEIDQILNGNQPIEKRAPESDEQIALRKKQIEIQLAEYEQALTDAAAWYREWKARQNKGFRCTKGA